MDALIEAAKEAGPAALGLLATGLGLLCAILYRRMNSAEARVADMHKEKEAMHLQWKSESEEVRERLMTAFINNTIAITSASANTTSLEKLINAAIIGGRRDEK